MTTESPHHRRLTSMLLPVAQALDVLQLKGEDRRRTRLRWKEQGLIDEQGRVDLVRVHPAAQRSEAPPQIRARSQDLFLENQRRRQQLERQEEAEARQRIQQRRQRALASSCGVFWS